MQDILSFLELHLFKLLTLFLNLINYFIRVKKMHEQTPSVNKREKITLTIFVNLIIFKYCFTKVICKKNKDSFN